MEKYAVIGKLKLQSIPGAKTLQMGFYNKIPFAVSKDLTENDLCIIFLPDGQLSKEYAEANNCIGKTDPDTGKRIGGFFGKNRKVRTLKLMGGEIHSLGYVAPIETLKFTGVDTSKLKEGTYISELNGIPICNKFINQKTKSNSIASGVIKKERELLGLKMHQDTSQFYRVKDTIKVGDFITITEKLDGTSVRCGKVYNPLKSSCVMSLHDNINLIFKYILKNITIKKIKVVLKYIRNIINTLLIRISKIELNMYKKFNIKSKDNFYAGTRRVLLNNKPIDSGFYNSLFMYKEKTDPLKYNIFNGESVYGEIVGWLDEDSPLFSRGGVDFIYGQPKGKRELYIYAIKWTLPGGEEIYLSWDATKARAIELGLKYVPELLPTTLITEDNRDEILEEYVDYFTKGQSTIDPTHIREGCVLRIDSGTSTRFIKSKSEEFYMLEDKFKNNENNIDIEEMNSGGT